MKIIQPLSPFEHFDPKGSFPTQHYLEDVGSILTDAREILYQRSREEIIFIVDSISYMLDKYDPLNIQNERTLELEKQEDPVFEGILKDRIDDFPEIDPDFPKAEILSRFSHPFLNPAEALSRLVGFYDIKDQSELKDAKWSEYFAALALALIGESVNIPYIISRDIKRDKLTDYYRESFNISFFVIHAMNAVGIAAKLRSWESDIKDLKEVAEKQVKQKVHLGQQLGGIKKHAENNKIKSDFIQFCENSFIPALENGEKLNVTAAAREYYEEFLEDRAPDKLNDPDGAFRHRDNTLRMLTTAWRNYKKTGLHPVQP
ncbi:MAG: hypothetical protein AB2654_11180 [Candidatus Thiodiazotropha sp.]